MTAPDSDKRCGAKNRQGKPCGLRPMKGKRRCKLHGGATPKGRHTGPMTHGIYGAALTEEEQDAWAEITGRLGSLDAEIHMIRVQLRRAFVAQRKATLDGGGDASRMEGLELAEVRRSTRGGKGEKPTVDAISRRPDYHAVIDRLSGRLASLEKTRAELLVAARESGEDAGGTARDLIDALRAMRATERRTDGEQQADGTDDDGDR